MLQPDDVTLDQLQAKNGQILDEGSGESPNGRKSQATQLIEFAESCTLFHDADGNGYAVTPGTPKQIWPVRQKGFKDWLRHRFYQETGKGVGGQAMQDAASGRFGLGTSSVEILGKDEFGGSHFFSPSCIVVSVGFR